MVATHSLARRVAFVFRLQPIDEVALGDRVGDGGRLRRIGGGRADPDDAGAVLDADDEVIEELVDDLIGPAASGLLGRELRLVAGGEPRRDGGRQGRDNRCANLFGPNPDRTRGSKRSIELGVPVNSQLIDDLFRQSAEVRTSISLRMPSLSVRPSVSTASRSVIRCSLVSKRISALAVYCCVTKENPDIGQDQAGCDKGENQKAATQEYPPQFRKIPFWPSQLYLRSGPAFVALVWSMYVVHSQFTPY